MENNLPLLPEALNDFSTTDLGQKVGTFVLRNDSDPEGKPLRIKSFTQANNGLVRFNNNGTINNTTDDKLVYFPNAGFSGIDSFTYTIANPSGATDTATVRIRVGGAPIAKDDVNNTKIGQKVGTFVLNNDSDPEGKPLKIKSFTQAGNGLVRFNNNGTANDTTDDKLVYFPNAGFRGTDSFTYTVADPTGATDTAKVTIRVGANNNPPIAKDDANNTKIGQKVGTFVLNNDSDPEGKPLKIKSFTQANNGLVRFNNNGTANDTTDDKLVYFPNAGFRGTDSFTYTVSDPNGATDTAKVTVRVGNNNNGLVLNRNINNNFDFDGTSDRIYIADNDNLDIKNKITLSAWINPDRIDNWDGIVTKGINNSPYGMQLWGDGSLRFSANRGLPNGSVGNGSWNSNSKILANEWSHVAVTYDGTNVRFYINGELDSKVVATDLTFGTNNQPLVLGADLPGADQYFDGQIDEVKVHNRALNKTQINNIIANSEFADIAPEATKGEFTGLIDWPIIAIHAGLLPDGRLFSFGQLGESASMGYRIWDSTKGTGDNAFVELPMIHENVSSFCSGMILIPETGQMLIAGGSMPTRSSVGINHTHFLDYRTDIMTMEPVFMKETRWYPTLTVLPDGRILAQGGASANDRIINNATIHTTPEIYTPGGEWELLEGATSSQVYDDGDNRQWWYPRSWVAPNGKVFGITWDDMYYLDPNNNGSIEVVGNFSTANRGIASTAVMYDEGKILQVGGGDTGVTTNDTPGNDPIRASDRATIIDINNGRPVLSSAGRMNYAREWADATVLPDGRVLVTGGGSLNNNAAGAVRTAEIWDPDTNEWSVVAEAVSPRLYHSSALLMADGTVFTGGSTTAGVDGETAEIYRPDYLFNDDGTAADRPDITGGDSSFDWGDSFRVNVAPGDDVDRVTLIGFGAVTHSVDMGQRFLELDFTQSGGSLTIEAPDSANIAPPGYYMLFALDENDVPSEAHIVNVNG